MNEDNLTCPNCGSLMEYHLDDFDHLHIYCPNCDDWIDEFIDDH